MEDFKVFDKSQALERAGGSRQLAEELFGMLIKELPSYRVQIADALRSRNFDGVRHHAHKLKGSATYCGVPALGNAAHILEGRIKRGDTSHAETDVDHLLVEIDRVLQFATQTAPFG